MTWRNLGEGAHTVIVKANCVIDDVIVSTIRRKFHFTVG